MSEEPRLSRRQLREMGELSPRDASLPSLTETEELRLRRPSRRELREAERSNTEAEDRIRATFEHVSGTDLPDAPAASFSGDNREPAAFGEFFEDFTAQEEAEANTREQPSENISPLDTQSSPERKSLFERFGDEEDDKPEPSLRDRLVGRTSEDFSSAAEDDAVSAEAGEKIEGICVKENNADAADDDLADPLTSDGGESGVENFVDSSDESSESDALDEAACTEVTCSEAACAEESFDEAACTETMNEDTADSEDKDSSSGDFSVVSVSDDCGDGDMLAENNQSADNPLNTQAKEPSSELSKLSEETAQLAVRETKESSADKDSESVVTVSAASSGSSPFGWLVLLILIVIGAMIGYLGGMWFAAVWLTAPSVGIESIVSSLLRL